MSAFEELKAKLKEIFQLDRNDLDFGLYRIMNLKAAEVSNFIDNELLPQVKEGLKSYSLNDNKAITEELKKAEEQAKELGMNPEDAPKVKELKAKLKDSFDSEKIENEIYSDLYNFFKRYYSEGDFLSLRRYKEGVYALPYEGEEVKLHWANADQYYIKSGETLTNYTFKVKDKKVRFEVVQATTEQNNNKDDKNRRFKLVEGDPVRVEIGVVYLFAVLFGLRRNVLVEQQQDPYYGQLPGHETVDMPEMRISGQRGVELPAFARAAAGHHGHGGQYQYHTSHCFGAFCELNL